jgi:transcription elongation factor GreA
MSTYITKEGLEKLKEELEYLKKVKRKEIAETLKQASSFGDLSENFAYQQAREDQSLLERRIFELEEMIRNAVVINKKNNDSVQVGSIVTVLLNGDKNKFKIVGPREGDPLQGKISIDSPLGKILLNKKKNEEGKADINGRIIKYKILSIE